MYEMKLKKMLRKVFLILVFLLGLFTFTRAQEKAAERYLEVRGTSELNMEPLPRATAVLFEGGTQVKSVQTGADGSFSFRLEINKQYTIVVEKEGMISKRISFNTSLPDEEKGAWMNEFSIGLAKKCDGVDYSVLKEPVDQVSFDPKRREFVSDKEYVSRMRPRIESMMIKNDQCQLETYESAVKKGDQLMAQKNYEEAIASYKKASEIYPTETYPGKRIADINAMVDKQQSSAEAYKIIVAEADALAAQQKYSEALQKYKNAAKLNPQEAYPTKKISEIEAALAQQQAAKQALQNTEDRYNQALAKASVAYTRKDYATARQYYQEALEIKPSESAPKARVQEIETIMAKKAAEDATRAAEAAQKAALESEYKSLIAKADEQFKAKNYAEASQSYARAQSMKPSDPFPAQRIKTIENAVAAEQIAMQKSKDDAYDAAMAAANKALAQGQFQLARDNYQKALSIKPEDQIAKSRINEVDRQAAEVAQRKSIDEQYKKAIETADALLKNNDAAKAKEYYVQALALKPGDQYAQSKIASIDNAVAAEQAARIKAAEDGYKSAIGAANTAITQQSYPQAKEYLQKALAIKPGDAYAMGKSAEVDRLIEEQRKTREQEKVIATQYNEAIAAADKSFQAKDYNIARSSYTKALQLKPGDTYASQKVISIDNIQAAELANRQKQVEDSYRGAMERGTGALIAKDYTAAAAAFQEALAIKPSDHSARTKLAEAETLIRQQQESIAAEQARKKKYEELLRTADQNFTQKNFTPARTAYEQALDVMPGEIYPRQKIDEIIQVVAEQERLLSEKQANENAYNLSLMNADKYFKAKDYIQARDEYARALKLKPEEVFPKNKIAEMENLISLRKKEQDEAKARADAYANAMNAGNASFGKKDYASAKISYSEALNLMPGDILAGDQIKKIDYILAEAEKVKQAEAARKASYESFIKTADNAFDAGNYTGAKEDYKKALAVEPASAYAKQRIARIDEINRILGQSSRNNSATPGASRQKVTAAIPMGELNFRTESERQKYLDELKQKYPSGITLEKYREQYKETYRYIIVRENQAQEFRSVKFTTFSGSQYSVNGKPITQQYFLSQTRPRQGETYQEIEMQ